MHKLMTANRYDFWAKDPYPLSETNRTAIIRKTWISSYRHDFFRFPDYDAFMEDRDKSLLFSASLSVHSKSFVIYKKRILWVDANTIEYRDVGTHTKDQSFPIPKDLNAVKMTYFQQNAANFIDLHVDEYGLYIVYANGKRENQLSITLLNDTTLQPNRTWHTNFYKNDVCAAFMMCGHLVTLTNCERRLGEGHNHYVYNTHTSQEYLVPATIVSLFGHIERLSYNPRERLVFGVDRTHAITVDPQWTLRSD